MLSSLRKRFPNLYALRVREAHAKQRRARMERIATVLADPVPPRPLDSDAALEDLLARRFAAPAPYRYDALSLWLRAATRIGRLATLGLLDEHPRRILEVCGGDGMVSQALVDLGHDVVMVDQKDWRAARAQCVPFEAVDVVRGLPFASASVDLLISYNAFEHVSEPRAVLAEMVRVCRPGGRILLDFGPLYASPYGLHAWSLGFPWPQYLLSPRLLDVALTASPLSDLGAEQQNLQPTNGWRLQQFRSLWAASGCIVDALREDEDHRFLDLVLEFPTAFSGRGLTFDDLIKNSIEVVLRRPA